MRKMKAVLIVALFAGSVFAAPLDYWTFDTDAAGQAFGANWINSGSLSSTWNYGGPATISTDGLGILVVSNHSGQTYRKLNAYPAPFTNGTYTLEFNLDSWELDSAAVGSTLTFGAMSSATDSQSFIAAIRVSVLDAFTARLQMFGHFEGAPNSAYRNFDFPLADAGGFDMAIEFDFDADTATYYTNGAVYESFTDFSGGQLETLQFNTSSSWTTQSVVSINEMGLSDDSTPEIDPWVQLEYFTFEAGAGQQFNGFANTGSLNSPWNYGGPPTIATDGAGSLVVSNHPGQVFRKLPGAGSTHAEAGADQYATPFTNGQYRLELDLDSWSLDGTSVGSAMSLQLRPTAASGGTAGMNLKVQDASTARVQLFYDSVVAGNQNNFRSFDFPLTNSIAQSYAIVFDYDLGTVEFFTNGVLLATSYEAFAGTQLGTLQFGCSSDWNTNHVVLIDAMGFSRFDESSEPVTAVDFDDTQIVSGIQYEYFDFALNLAGSPQAELPEHSGQPIYAGLKLDPVNGKTTGDDGGSYTNGGAIVFNSNGGAKLQWNGPFPGSPGDDAGRYEEDDVATGIFLFKQEDFLNGLDIGTVFMDVTNDTLSAVVRLDTKETHGAFPLQRLKSGKFRWVVQDAGSFYISAEVTNLTSDTGDVELTDEALELSWFDYDPETSITGISTAASPTLLDIQSIGFWMSATILTNDGNRTYPNMQCSSFEAAATRSAATTPTELYAEWIGGYPGAGANNGMKDDAEPDGLENLFEYAIDSDPTSPVNVNTPVQSQVAEGGTNYVEYIYLERDDAASRGLNSILTVATDLVVADWADGSPYEVGSGASGVSGFNAVTNRIPIDTETQQFIRLQIQFTP